MITLPNLLSFSRIPLALLFLYDNIAVRAAIVLFAAATDFFDGYIARQRKQQSRIGTILDPVSDKIFVMTALALFLFEGKISPLGVAAMLCRDFSIILFGLYLMITGNFSKYQFRSIWCGKITTTLQLLTLMGLTLGAALPTYIYTIFILLGTTALIELYISKNVRHLNKEA